MKNMILYQLAIYLAVFTDLNIKFITTSAKIEATAALLQKNTPPQHSIFDIVLPTESNV